MSMTSTVLVCPHCASQSAYQVGMDGNGSQGVQCKHCHKSIRVYYQQGMLKDVKKS